MIYGGPDGVEDGLVLCLDASNPKSYPGSGITWYDLSINGNHHTTTGAPPIVNGVFVLDGSTQGFTKTSALTGTTANCTVVIWYSTVDTQELWVMGNHNGSWYLAAAAGGGAYYHGNVGSPINYVDTAVVTVPAPYRDGAFHMWEAKNVDFTSWTYYDWFLYSDDPGWKMAGKVGVIMVYNKILTAAESLQNYNELKGRFGK